MNALAVYDSKQEKDLAEETGEKRKRKSKTGQVRGILPQS